MDEHCTTTKNCLPDFEDQLWLYEVSKVVLLVPAYFHELSVEI